MNYCQQQNRVVKQSQLTQFLDIVITLNPEVSIWSKSMTETLETGVLCA